MKICILVLKLAALGLGLVAFVVGIIGGSLSLLYLGIWGFTTVWNGFVPVVFNTPEINTFQGMCGLILLAVAGSFLRDRR